MESAAADSSLAQRQKTAGVLVSLITACEFFIEFALGSISK